MKSATLAIVNQEGKRLPITVPLDAVIQVVAGPMDENWMVDVEWDGRKLTMFARDLLERGELVEEDGI